MKSLLHVVICTSCISKVPVFVTMLLNMQLCPTHFLPCLLLSQCPLTCRGLHIFLVFNGVLHTVMFSYSYVNFHILAPRDFPFVYFFLQSTLLPTPLPLLAGPQGTMAEAVDTGGRLHSREAGPASLCFPGLCQCFHRLTYLRTGCCVL